MSFEDEFMSERVLREVNSIRKTENKRLIGSSKFVEVEPLFDKPGYQYARPTVKIGDLIRNRDTFTFINLVLKIEVCRSYMVIHSVRYIYSANGDKEYLKADRIRPFKVYPHNTKWMRVVEVKEVLVDNTASIKQFLNDLPPLDTMYWSPPPDEFNS